jgi:hypothetical protein
VSYKLGAIEALVHPEAAQKIFDSIAQTNSDLNERISEKHKTLRE